MASDTEARVYDILGKLQSLDKVRELFSELNYDPAHELLSRQNWGGAAGDALAEDPQVIACHDDFKVIYARLNSERLLLGDERPVVNRLLQEHPYLLCLFSDSEQQQWHFVNIKYDEEIKKRRLFRRITVGPDERLRTATERLSQLDLERIRHDLAGIYPLDIQQRHDAAFDVEVVTREFYNTFVELFHQIKNEIATNNPTYKNEAPTEAQMLLNRLMFLYFTQKKGWLDNNPHYLWEKFQEHYGSEPRGHSFYSDFLIRLFQQLSNEQLKFDDLGSIPFLNGGLFETEPFSSQLPFDLQISNSTFRDIFDKLLEHFNFTVREDTPLDVEVAIDPEMLGRIFENLILQLERERDLRKMTGSYYTPRVIVHFMCQQALKEYLATESQIDPSRLEMLLELNPPDQLEDWEVDLLKDIVTVPEARVLRDLAKRAFVIDPAVGSGAFLVGMLHEMLTIVKQMDVREHGPECIARRNYEYELKRDMIEKCLYGVDILEPAVRICELRLWLSLVVDYDRELGEDVPPLPNLSYQVKQGDSLIETLFGQHVQFDTLTRTDKGRQLIDEMQQEKHAYFLTQGLNEKRQKELSILAKQCELAESLVKEKRQTLGTKQRLFGELSTKEARENEEVREQIASLDKLLYSATNAKQKARAWLEGKLPATSTDINKLRQDLGISFIWRLDFAEVFKKKGGFDIVIANPPYLESRSPNFPDDVKDKLQLAVRRRWGNSFQYITRGADLLVYFFEISIYIINGRGTIVLIAQNSWLDTLYGKKFQRFLMENTHVEKIVDSDFKYFDSKGGPNVNTVISILKGKNPRIDDTVIFTRFHESFEKIPLPLSDLENLQDKGYVEYHKYTYSDEVLSEVKWGILLSAEEFILNLLKTLKSRGYYIDQIGRHQISIGQGLNLPKEHIINDDNIREFPFLNNANIPFMTSCDGAPFVLKRTKNYLIDTSKISSAEKALLTSKGIRTFDSAQTTKVKPILVLPRGISKHFCSMNMALAFSASFVEIYDDGEVLDANMKLNLWLFLNSSVAWLLREISGRKNLGGGLLKAEAADLKQLPIYFDFNRNLDIINVYNRLKDREALDTIEEIYTPEHKIIDNTVFDYLGIPGDIRIKTINALKTRILGRFEKSVT